MMNQIRPTSEVFRDVVPEIDQHDVRYSECTSKLPKTPKSPKTPKTSIVLSKSKNNKEDVIPIIDCEIDDDSDVPDYSILEYTMSIEQIKSMHQEEKKIKNKELKKSEEKKNEELTLKSIYNTLREMKHSAIHKIIVANKNEFLKIKQNPPNKEYLSSADQFLKTMFNPDQKSKMYTFIRTVLNVPPNVFREVQYIMTLLLPEAAIMIFQKKYKISTRVEAMGLLSKLELCDPTFYEKRAAKDFFCRT